MATVTAELALVVLGFGDLTAAGFVEDDLASVVTAELAVGTGSWDEALTWDALELFALLDTVVLELASDLALAVEIVLAVDDDDASADVSVAVPLLQAAKVVNPTIKIANQTKVRFINNSSS
ncbi:hypothetical protein DY78_GL000068 [Lactiplantibacillus fabifermentans DSM 21115]|uniref:Uncharacterized protein n=1 Tax=Lactiplantibacillus fabifermentans DSM 21115 TaxID=1413187 RepID=A0A0R2NNW3_9LACO|nr:hypothetical protein DY78_GL000068 [Lactiplantibacillus fabifermentans DSM 21115]